ncbi:MAG: flagellar basal body P-ring formation chaperone FlgA [Bacteriovoracaceae bacterium]|nr:flagellar basal body P-ring formation chaperone FlgA [Bacteriovoracaceae bacterium]
MKMFHIILLFQFLLWGTSASAFTNPEREIKEECTIETFASIYRLSPSQYFAPKDVIKSSNCDNLVINKFTQILMSLEGIALSNVLEKELSEDFKNIKITLNPAKIFVGNLNDYLKTNLANETNLFFTDTRLSSTKKVLTLNEEELIEVSCESCLSYGDKNIKIDLVHPINATRISQWLSTKVTAKITVLKANKNINLQNEGFKKDDFITEDLLTTQPDKFISQFEMIKFYKPNKVIIQGMPLTNQDIAPLQLVRYGTPVKVVLKNNNISIIKSAIPHKSANFGETIELKNPSNNKLISGKVVDFNKVLIEL